MNFLVTDRLAGKLEMFGMVVEVEVEVQANPVYQLIGINGKRF
jgi:hypothetical protein